ncbi:hypothetical protein J4217_03275 [Candidatus Pacearchaeota archaeon]|nr:hypothetical protein [Candidatus Pacearchaeota archaeon]
MLKKGDKKGVSEIVSYALLVIIAVGIAVLVYAFLRVYVPKDKLECPDNIAIAIKEVACNYDSAGTTLELTLANKGFFNISNVLIRMGNESRQTKYLLTTGSKGFKLTPPLPPGEEGVRALPPLNVPIRAVNAPGVYNLEIQLAMKTDKGIALCNNAIINEKINCAATVP